MGDEFEFNGPDRVSEIGDLEPHPAHEQKKCNECNCYSRDVFDRASFRVTKLLCRQCVEKVEDERQSKKARETINLIMENYKDD